MMKQWVSGVLLSCAVVFTAPVMTVQAKDLPDFTELAEKQGPAVVNISITSVVHGGGMGFPGMPNDENLQELLRRFGIPGMPGAPGQDGVDKAAPKKEKTAKEREAPNDSGTGNSA